MRTANRRLHYSLLLGLCLIAHGLLLLNEGIYWDDWYLHVALSQHNWPSIALLSQRGIPTDPYLYWIVGFGGRVFTFKLVKFLSIALIGILVYESCIASRRIPPAQALAIAALSLTYPGDETPVILMTANYYVYYALFWLAVLLALLSEDRDRSTGSRKILLSVSVALFLLSFNLNSLLAFYFGFLVVLITSIPRPRRLATRHVVFLLLPFIFWLARILLFPPRGYFAGYNRIDLNPVSLVRQLARFVYFAGFVQSNETLRQLVTLPLVTALTFVLSWYFFSRFRLDDSHFGLSPPIAIRRLLYGLVLAFLAVLPYATVGKAPAVAHGPNTRCELLLGLPVAWLVVWSITLLFDITDGLSRAAFLTLMVVLAAFTLQTLHTYVSWEAEWARERALVSALGQHREGNRFKTLWLCDDRLSANPYFVTGIDALLLAAWGPESGVLIDPAWDSQELRLRHPDELQHPDRVFALPGEIPARVIEPQGTLTICSLQDSSDAQLAVTHLLNRFSRPDRLSLLYQKLVSVEFRPGSLPPQARRPCCSQPSLR